MKIIYFIIAFFISIVIEAQTITGIVTDDQGIPLPYVNVFIPDNKIGVLTDDNGNFTLKHLSAGTVKIQFSEIGYETVLKTIVIKKSETKKITIQLHEEAIRGQDVVVSGGTYTVQHNNAITITSIKAREIHSIGTPSVMEAIASRPGVHVIEKSPGVSVPSIRGLSLDNILVLNNGFKLSNYQFSEDHPYLVNSYGIDKVEVIKGPASILYGAGALGGVINFIKERPAAYGTVEGDANLQYHSNTEGMVGNVGVKGHQGDIVWGLRAGSQSHKDFKDGRDSIVHNSRFNKDNLSAMAGILKPVGSFKVYYDYNAFALGMTVPPALKEVNANERKNKVWFQHLDNHLISTRNTLFFNKLKIDFDAAYQINHRRLETDTLMPAVTLIDMEDRLLVYDVKMRYRFSKKNLLIGGMQGNTENNRNATAPVVLLPDADMSTISAFALWQGNYFSEKLHTQIGVRYDLTTLHILLDEARDMQYENPSFTAGMTYKLSSRLLWRVNIASAFRAPNLAELTQDGLHGTRYEKGNAELNPQRNYEADMSLHYHINKFELTASPFYNRILDYIYLSPTADTTAGGQTIYRYLQSNSTIYGGEVSGESLLMPFLKAKASYGYLHGVQDNGNYLPLIPQNTVRLSLTAFWKQYRFIKKPSVSLESVNAFAQNHPSSFETKTNGYQLLNMIFSGQTVLKGANVLSYSLAIRNVFNTVYIDHLSTLKEIGYYNQGRNIVVTLSLKF